MNATPYTNSRNCMKSKFNISNRFFSMIILKWFLKNNKKDIFESEKITTKKRQF